MPWNTCKKIVFTTWICVWLAYVYICVDDISSVIVMRVQIVVVLMSENI